MERFNVVREEFRGQPAVKLILPGITLVVLENLLRIVHLGPNLERNLLYLDWDGKFKRDNWGLLGGHRIWFALPGADESEVAYLPDAGPITMEEQDDGSIVFTAPPDGMKLVKGFIIRPLRNSTVEVVNFVQNASDMLAAGAVWAITCTDPVANKAVYASRLNSGNQGWDSCQVALFPTWGGGHQTTAAGNAQFDITVDDGIGQWLQVLRPVGEEAKRAWWAPFGGQVMAMPDMTLAKIAEVKPGMPYPINGCNAAMYCGPWARTEDAGPAMVEMESMGPEVQLLPGDTTYHPEIISLATRAMDTANFGDMSVFNRPHIFESLPRE